MALRKGVLLREGRRVPRGALREGTERGMSGASRGGAALRRGAHREGATFTDLHMTARACRCPGVESRVRVQELDGSNGDRSMCACHMHARSGKMSVLRGWGGECESVVCVSEQDGVLATCRHASRFWESACDCCDWVRPSARCGCDKQGGQWGAPRGALPCYAATRRSRRVPRQGGPRLGPRQATGRCMGR